MKKLCLVIPTLGPGGMERVMSELSHYFSNKKDLELHLLLYGIKREIFYNIPATIIVHKPKFEFNNANRIYSTLKTLLFIRKKIMKIKPDIILSFGEYWNSFVLLGLLGLKYPVFISDRCQPDKNFGTFHGILRKWLYPKAKGIIAQTEIAKKIYINQFKHPNIKVIGNPIRQIDVSNSKISQREKIILSVGRLIASKHHDQLVKIFASIKMHDWKLVIVGGDALKQNGFEKLTLKIKELNIEDRVQLTGTITNTDDYYIKSEIFAFTSSSEGFPNAIGEAMSAGLATIAYDCIAGPSEMIKDGENGYLVPLFNSRLFQNRLQSLIDNPKLRRKFGEKAKEDIQNYSIDVIGAKYYSFITNSLS